MCKTRKRALEVGPRLCSAMTPFPIQADVNCVCAERCGTCAFFTTCAHAGAPDQLLRFACSLGTRKHYVIEQSPRSFFFCRLWDKLVREGHTVTYRLRTDLTKPMKGMLTRTTRRTDAGVLARCVLGGRRFASTASYVYNVSTLTIPDSIKILHMRP